MNRYGLIFNIFLSVLVFALSCKQPKLYNISGIYKAQVSIQHAQQDTTFNSVLIINNLLEKPYHYQLQWNFDDYIIFRNSRLGLPNILHLSLRAKQFINSPFVQLELRQNPGIEDFYGLYTPDSLVVSFYYPATDLRVSIRSYL